jgi:hypothetical protein
MASGVRKNIGLDEGKCGLPPAADGPRVLTEFRVEPEERVRPMISCRSPANPPCR